ncbi:hypothetical protein DFH09DRAFT_1415979 [Mycena vulgaris]|nr:hypothetical protein DFH09DRAFT_1415979 [Mycena vulgaris]
MDFDLRSRSGDRLLPIWSVNSGIRWASFGAPAAEIPAEANALINLFPPFPKQRGLVRLSEAAIYEPRLHWLGWSPTCGLVDEDNDPAAFVFNANPVTLTEQYDDVQRSGGSDDGDSPNLVGFVLPDFWSTNALYLSRRLYDISMTLVLKTDWYGPNEDTTRLGDMPAQLDEEELARIHYYSKDAHESANEARRILLSQMGFVNWFSSVKTNWSDDLSQDDRDFLKELYLGDRPKRGYVFNLSRDYHEMNPRHLLSNDVPFHYSWTDAEADTGRFLRYSPGFFEEYERLIDATPVGLTLDLQRLPSYATMRNDLERYDVFFQDAGVGRVGEIVMEMFPDLKHYVVDFLHYGARPIANRSVRRAYSERFHGRIQYGGNHAVCTWYRQNPLGKDEPPMDRFVPGHRFSLEQFAPVEMGPHVRESAAFFESTYQIREQVKNRYAPRESEGRTFNNFNGLLNHVLHTSLHSSQGRTNPSEARTETSGETSSAPEARGDDRPGRPLSLTERMEGADIRRSRAPMSPTRRSDSPSDAGLESRWARSMAAPARRRSSRSLSPHEHREARRLGRNARSLSRERTPSVLNEYLDATAEIEDGEMAEEFEGSATQINPSPVQISSGSSSQLPSAASPLVDYEARFQSREEASEKIRTWSRHILDVVEKEAAGEEWWNIEWLQNSILVCDDFRSFVRFKTWAACDDSINDVITILNKAIRSGVPFGIYVRQGSARKLGDLQPLTALQLATSASLYSLGYTDTLLEYGSGGVRLFFRYTSQVGALLSRPHAVAFIAAGGILSFLAQMFDAELLNRFRNGPSAQVTQYQKGHTILRTIGDEEEFYTADQISEDEISILIGHVATGNPATETFLWPHPSLLEEKSYHVQGGAWTTGFHSLLVNLQKTIIEKKIYRWRTTKEWIRYLEVGNRGGFTPEIVPTDQDFDNGWTMMKRAFPVDWEAKRISEIILPETFDPHAHRE